MKDKIQIWRAKLKAQKNKVEMLYVKRFRGLKNKIQLYIVYNIHIFIYVHRKSKVFKG